MSSRGLPSSSCTSVQVLPRLVGDASCKCTCPQPGVGHQMWAAASQHQHSRQLRVRRGSSRLIAASASASEPAPPASGPGPIEQAILAIGAIATTLFPVWVIGAAVGGFHRPELFNWFHTSQITNGLMFVMLGMGLTLTFEEIGAVFTRQPQLLALGMMLQYSVLPAVGYTISRYWGLEPGLAIGLALVSCMPGGTASNIVAFIARGDMPLSVMMTSASTLMAVFMTPFLTTLLVGQLVPVDPKAMFVSVLQLVLLPVLVGCTINSIAPAFVSHASTYIAVAWQTLRKKGEVGWTKMTWSRVCRVPPSMFTTAAQAWWIIVKLSTTCMNEHAHRMHRTHGALYNMLLCRCSRMLFLVVAFFIQISCLLSTLTFLECMRVALHVLWLQVRRVRPFMPLAATIVIMLLIGSMVSCNVHIVGAYGPQVIPAVFMLHSTGFFLGYWLSKAIGTTDKVARTNSIETGMQSSALAAVLAKLHFPDQPMVVAACVMSACTHALLGSILAGVWNATVTYDTMLSTKDEGLTSGERRHHMLQAWESQGDTKLSTTQRNVTCRWVVFVVNAPFL
ncbi:putative sodium/metabolite cotransporter BASS1, chloroplastic [Haematococcus lacustris]|uniref:Putative sodium/metabolite cotransporter BASS1, chloroplastic n=1 Tax=Haematococcus lacustris TaxID=44745 RepID=A0A699ZN76_HAELA|nr:putative sodium/metabolite cotransporter BASS1, chloroplastic [Haematococcus lacustris]